MYTKLTLADCLASLADRHDAGKLPVKAATLTLWTRLINRGVDYCARKLNLYKTATLTTVSGTIALPTDFKSIFRVFSGQLEFSQVGADDTNMQVGYTFWITGNHLEGFYLNASGDIDFIVDYYFYPAPLVSNSDVCIISDIEAPVAYAYAMLRKSESDPFEDSDSALQECDARINDMKSDVMANNANLDFSLISGS